MEHMDLSVEMHQSKTTVAYQQVLYIYVLGKNFGWQTTNLASDSIETDFKLCICSSNTDLFFLDPLVVVSL